MPLATLATSNMNQWQQICENPRFHDMPYTIETDALGKIIMSPTTLAHGNFQSKIAHLLMKHLQEGKVITECTIETTDGMKVVDVAWMSEGLWQQSKEKLATSIAPEICIEILSTSNTVEEMQHKKALYFEKGAKEFWLCNQEGQLQIFDDDKQLATSALVPDFPLVIEE